MAVPDFQSLMRPCLAVHQDRQPHTSADLRDRLAAQMHVSAEERAIMIPSGRAPLFSNRVAWAVTHLAQAGLLDRPARGVTQITDRGIEVLTQHPQRVDIKVLRQFPEYQEFRTRTKQRKGQPAGDASTLDRASHEDLSPREAIEDVIDSAHSAVAADLLARVLKQPPVFLEQLVLQLLVKMGYGGLETPTEHLGAPGDAGLDGLIRLDPSGLTLFTFRPSATPTVTSGVLTFRPSLAHCTGHRQAAESSSPHPVSAPMPVTTPTASTRASSSSTAQNLPPS
jgi:restriction system protein